MGDSEGQRKPTMLQSTGLQRIRHDLATEQKQLTSHSSYSTANLEGGGDGKKKEKKMYLSSIFKLEIFNEPPWLFHISSCLPTRYSLSYTLFKVICVVNNHCLVEIISPLGEGLETGTLVK